MKKKTCNDYPERERMKMRCKIIILFILFQVFITNFLIADTHIPPGDVSGTWTIDGSPYIVDGYVIVPVDSTLIIEPSVFVIFSTNNGLRIKGKLISEATENDSIVFTVQDTTNNTGIGFYHTDITDQDSSKISYSIFEHVGVHFDKSSNIVFQKSRVSKCMAYGGVHFDEVSCPTLMDVTISNNSSTSYGGGIYCTDGSCPRLKNVTVVGNNPNGIWCSYNSDPIIENSNIIDNTGMGICCTYYSGTSLYNVTISGNSQGGVISCSYGNSNIIIENSKICNNSGGGGIHTDGTKLTLKNVLIAGNNCDDLGGGGMSVTGDDEIDLYNVKIIGNTSSYDGGGFYAGYGVFVINMFNVLIANNYAWNSGGGINIVDGPILRARNVTICDNSTDGLGGGLMCQLEAEAVLYNSIVWNNSNGEIIEYWTGDDAVKVYYSDVRGGWSGPGSNNINSYPQFADTLYHLSEYSPCVDTGNPDTVGLSIPPWDLDGHVRIWDGNGDGIAIIDMGVYEYDAPVYSVHEPEMPEQSLIHNYPNPFTESTTISFLKTTRLLYDTPGQAEIRIYNIKGQLVRNLPIISSPHRSISVAWDGRDNRGKEVGAGIYLYKLTADKKETIKKMVIIR